MCKWKTANYVQNLSLSHIFTFLIFTTKKVFGTPTRHGALRVHCPVVVNQTFVLCRYLAKFFVYRLTWCHLTKLYVCRLTWCHLTNFTFAGWPVAIWRFFSLFSGWLGPVGQRDCRRLRGRHRVLEAVQVRAVELPHHGLPHSAGLFAAQHRWQSCSPCHWRWRQPS